MACKVSKGWFPQETVAQYAAVSLDVETGFREPALIDLLTGDVYALDAFESSAGKTRFNALPLADYPMVISERSELRLAG